MRGLEVGRAVPCPPSGDGRWALAEKPTSHYFRAAGSPGLPGALPSMTDALPSVQDAGRGRVGLVRLLPPAEGHVKLPGMSTLAEIENAVDALPPPQQEELLRHLAKRLRLQGEPKGRLPLVPATGHPITQEEIDDALEAD